MREIGIEEERRGIRRIDEKWNQEEEENEDKE